MLTTPPNVIQINKYADAALHHFSPFDISSRSGLDSDRTRSLLSSPSLITNHITSYTSAHLRFDKRDFFHQPLTVVILSSLDHSQNVYHSNPPHPTLLFRPLRQPSPKKPMYHHQPRFQLKLPPIQVSSTTLSLTKPTSPAPHPASHQHHRRIHHQTPRY